MSLKFKHALVALDQSEASEIIVDSLASFKKFGTEKFTLFTSANVPYPGGLDSTELENYRHKLDIYKLHLETNGFDVVTEVREKINSYTPVEILNAAHDAEADYIIIANRGHNKLKELLLGSTATELLQRCDLPVFLIKLDVSDQSEMSDRKLYGMISIQKSQDRILFPTDFSTTSDRAFETLKMLAGNAKNVDILHVQATGRPGMNDPKRVEEFDRTDTERLKELKAELEDVSDAEISVKVRYGSAITQIIDFAESVDSTMIVMGSQGRGYVSDLFLGGVSHQVIRKAKVPVLTIPAIRFDDTD
ncbi:MAG: universal stress protein [Balneolaceae bacterium]|nr:universal stress protein [Balneolaceae bacterium]